MQMMGFRTLTSGNGFCWLYVVKSCAVNVFLYLLKFRLFLSFRIIRGVASSRRDYDRVV